MKDRIINSYSQCMLYFDLLNVIGDLNQTVIFEYLTNTNHILDRCNKKKPIENIYITLSELGKLFHLDSRTVSKCLIDLEEKGFIKINKKVVRIGWFIGFTDKAVQVKQDEAEVFKEYQSAKREYYSFKSNPNKKVEKPTTKDKSTKSDTTQNNNDEKDIKSLNVEEQIKLNKERKDNKLKNKKQLGFI